MRTASLVAAIGVLVSAGCAGRAATPANEPGVMDDGVPRVEFTRPQDGAVVASPFEVCLEVSGLVVAPAGDVVAGEGHHHVIVDPSLSERAQYLAGEPLAVPSDETHIHMGDGSSCVMIEALPGQRSLMAVVADGAHVNMDPPVVAEIAVIVE